MNNNRVAIVALCIAFLAIGIAVAAFYNANESAVGDVMNDSINLMEKYKDWNPFDPSKRLDKAKAEIANAKSTASRLHPLGDAGMACVDLGQLEQAQKYAEELLSLSDRIYPGKGDADSIHKGNLVLGRIELRRGNTDKAKALLLKAGRVEGSPVLGSFGPNMTLAKELLEKNEKEVVLEYFKLCEAFWKHDLGDSLKKWTEQVKTGKTPNFSANLHY